MNNNTTTGIRHTTRRFLAVLALLATTVGVTLGTAAPSQASGYQYQGDVGYNSYYGWVSGNAYIPYGTQDRVDFALYYRDNRDDGYCSVTQVRGVTNANTATGWKRIGNSCSTSPASYGFTTVYPPAGYYFTGAQVRSCQSDRYGSAIGACTSAKWVNNWRVTAY